MKIQELMDKIAEENIHLWDLPQSTLVVRDSAGRTLSVTDLKINKDNKNATWNAINEELENIC